VRGGGREAPLYSIVGTKEKSGHWKGESEDEILGSRADSPITDCTLPCFLNYRILRIVRT
jgi:hypothetical protein